MANHRRRQLIPVLRDIEPTAPVDESGQTQPCMFSRGSMSDMLETLRSPRAPTKRIPSELLEGLVALARIRR